MSTEITRCDWASNNSLLQEYHDREWGLPAHDDKRLFKMLCLEGQQAGLSWLLILKKWDALREAYNDFDPATLVHFDDQKVEELLHNDGIIKNRLKINSAIHNANVYFEICEKYASLDNFLWSYVDHQPIVNAWTRMDQIPASTPLSDTISKDLKTLGFKFVGSTTIYAFMQSVGMVNDHLTSCAFYHRSGS
jgi:DNA-3-methyladenine glycosylase I